MNKEWEKKPSDFALWTLQNEHGLIFPERSKSLWPKKDWPALTLIGEMLVADMGLIDTIITHSAGNLTIAKLRLEEICEADTLESFRLIRDRLPRKVVSLFDSQIASVKVQDRSVAMLGLSAIKLVIKEAGDIDNEEIKRRLQVFGRKDGIGSLDVQEILHATKGLLRESKGGQHLEAYHTDFDRYAIERYNEDLEHHKI